MMKHLRTAICLILIFGESLSSAPKFELHEELPPLGEKERSALLILLMDRLGEDKVSTDSAWEVFSAFVGEGETDRDKAMSFVNMLFNGQAPLTKREGYKVRPTGPFIRDCSATLSINREALLNHFTANIVDDLHAEKCVLFDARKLFLSLGTKSLEGLIEEKLKPTPPTNTTDSERTKEGDTVQPANRSEAKSESSKKSQTESGELTR